MILSPERSTKVRPSRNGFASTLERRRWVFRVLLVSKPGPQRAQLERDLRRIGYRAAGFDPASPRIPKCDLVVLDLGCAQANLEWLDRVRTDGTAVLVIGEARLDERVRLLDAGGDDVQAQCVLPELLARLRSLLRRTHPYLLAGNFELETWGVQLNWASRQANLNGQAVALSLREFLLLEVLAAAQGKAIARHELAAQIELAPVTALAELAESICEKLGDVIETVKGSYRLRC